jgi:hypothetical protein
MGSLQAEGRYTSYVVEITVFKKGDKNSHCERGSM